MEIGKRETDRQQQSSRQTARRNIFRREQSMEIFRISLDDPVIREKARSTKIDQFFFRKVSGGTGGHSLIKKNYIANA